MLQRYTNDAAEVIQKSRIANDRVCSLERRKKLFEDQTFSSLCKHRYCAATTIVTPDSTDRPAPLLNSPLQRRALICNRLSETVRCGSVYFRTPIRAVLNAENSTNINVKTTAVCIQFSTACVYVWSRIFTRVYSVYNNYKIVKNNLKSILDDIITNFYFFPIVFERYTFGKQYILRSLCLKNNLNTFVLRI